jgi:uncharacterized protein (TIGR04562 family)
MQFDYRFDVNMLESLVGGKSSLDLRGLKIQNLEQAYNFIKTYGYDINKLTDEKQLWNYHRRAVNYIQSELLNEGEEFPEILSDPNKLQNIANILIYASIGDEKEKSIQRWACAILKVMHAIVHLENDLFNQYSQSIQDQILDPIRKHIYRDPLEGSFLGHSTDKDHISLKKFIVKSFKSSNSSITKLLAKQEVVAFTLLDKVGVRFVTKHVFDVFRVMRYLLEHHIISFPHNIPDQSSNTLYPLNLFLEVMEGFTHKDDFKLEEIDKILSSKLETSINRAEFRDKYNTFSSKDYRFMKFITRRLIKIEIPQAESGKSRELNFFYPYEVQIIDYETYLLNLTGEAAHDKYKERQKMSARVRVFGKSL